MKPLIGLALAAAFAAPAISQDKPKPPPIWHQGKPPAQAESKLAPHADTKTETTTETKPESKPESKPEKKSEGKSETKAAA